MLIDMVNNIVIFMNMVHYKWSGIQNVTANVKTDKINVLQIIPIHFEPFDITYIFYLDILDE